MANTKKIKQAWSETGKTVYCTVIRDSDGYLLNNADGTFAAAPAGPYLSLSEHGTVKGLYSVSESRQAWNDDRYGVYIYRQAGGSPAPASDTLIGAGEMFMAGDLEVTSDTLRGQVLELREGNVQREFTIAATNIPARNVAAGQLDSVTLKVKADSASDWTSPVSTKTLYFVYQNMGDSDPIRVGA